MRGLIVCLVAACSPPPGSTKSPARPTPTAAPLKGAPTGSPSYLTSSRIVAIDGGLVVSDGDSGMFVRTDANGNAVAQVKVGGGQLAYDPARRVAFVADRTSDRIVVVDKDTTIARTWKTPVEPYGVAMTPDRTSVLVTSIADRVLVAYDPETGAEQWRIALPSEPRAIAVAPDGKRALIASIGGALDEIALDTRKVTQIKYPLDCDMCVAGTAYARGSAVMFLDGVRAIASFQREVPEAIEMFQNPGLYGGSSTPPITQHLSFIAFDGEDRNQTVAQVIANQPKSIHYDRKDDVFYVGGHASDSLLRLRGLLAGKSTEGVENASDEVMLHATSACGPDGIAQAADGTVYVWCAFSRLVLRLPTTGQQLREGSPVAESALADVEHQGYVLFDSIQSNINRDRAMACSTCHIDGRADGLSWKIRTQTLQTPALAGRVRETQPYKWDASDKSLQDSIKSTVTRLGGRGLSTPQSLALVAYLNVLPRPRVPTIDREAAARGKKIFEGKGGCADCHNGPRLTDGHTHRFPASSLVDADTPSLIGLAATGPYYHDGSAPTLQALVAGRGTVHGMGNLGALDAVQRGDLAAYLASL